MAWLMPDEPFTRASPWPPEHAHSVIDLASAEVPSGAAWLVNCLLELGIPAWQPWGSNDCAHWRRLDNGGYRYVGGDNGWSRVLPALQADREFRFRDDVRVRAHHTWPGVFPAADRRILFVRDPRDALCSAWRRHLRLEALPRQDFAAFRNSRFFHYPVSWQDYLLLFLRVWRLSAEKDPIRIVRFEDYRQDAEATLGAVTAWLGIEAAPDAIRHAAEASSVQRVEAEDRRLVRLGVVETPLVRGVAPGEHERMLDPAERLDLDHRFDDVCEWLGYRRTSTSAARGHAPPPPGLHPGVMDAMRRAGVVFREDGWLSDAVSASLAGIDFVQPDPP